jgi:hypothetical protein
VLYQAAGAPPWARGVTGSFPLIDRGTVQVRILPGPLPEERHIMLTDEERKYQVRIRRMAMVLAMVLSSAACVSAVLGVYALARLVF